ncbi:peptide/nickel transport system substrate-binding protein [Limimonas halophila]|uniref:Peptide/nickel transport system substrate-binding protein n=1 Tax=Limimonas halophila TaxID=1082479 RepID=A0A1G7T2B3_9PROT|nr:peptide ABC transporter substrate-binding protein [Limimonas halophila]SDG28730.1 peptide/nickel transport system substrate-binding protein [Limimonas halophila]
MRALAAAAITAALALTSAGAAAQDGEAGGAGTLTIGIDQFPSTFHPSINAMLAKAYMHGLTRRPVTAYGPDWDLVCMLCTEVPTLDNGLAEKETLPNGDTGIAITYKLHPEARWGDGHPVTSEDVKFAVRVGQHPKSGVPGTEIYERIREVEVHGPKRFTLHIDRVTFDYNAFSMPLLPAHLEREVFDADPAEYRHRTTFQRQPTNPGLYNGPYRMASVERGSRAVFEPNPEWHGEPPAFDRVVVRTIENAAALEANLLSGSIDMIAGELGLTVNQALKLKERAGDRFQFAFKPGLIYEHIDFNLGNPILKNRKVRRALAYAADREMIVQQLFGGEQPVADGPISPLADAHAEDVPTYGHDPEKARELLDAAGWDDKRRGIRHKDGEPLRLTFMTTAGNRVRELVQTTLQSQWKAVGVDVRIANQPARVFFGETMAKRDYKAMGMYAWLSAPRSVPRTTLHSDHIPTADNNWSGQNYPGYTNKRMDELLTRIETELDTQKRHELFAEMQRLYAKDLPALPLYWRAQAHVLPTWLTGFRATGHQFPSTLWVEQWGRSGAQ